MNAQMMRVISSPSSSTIGFLTLIFAIGRPGRRRHPARQCSAAGSIQLARVFGIRIGVEPSWFLVLFLIIWSLSG